MRTRSRAVIGFALFKKQPTATEIREEMALFATWYNQHRPHRALDGRTPAECAAGTVAKSEPSQPEPNQRLTLVVGYLEGRRHLPVVQIRRAA